MTNKRGVRGRVRKMSINKYSSLEDHQDFKKKN